MAEEPFISSSDNTINAPLGTDMTLPSSVSDRFDFPQYTTFPPFYTLQHNLTIRARQLELWTDFISSYCAHHRIFRLLLSSVPHELINHPSLKRSLKPADLRTVLEHMSKPENGPRIEWIAPARKGEPSNSCYVYWKTAGEWADAIYGWVDETGQKGTVLTVYELREGDAARSREWRDMDEGMLRRVLDVIVKRGKAQIFGLEESAGVKFF